MRKISLIFVLVVFAALQAVVAKPTTVRTEECWTDISSQQIEECGQWEPGFYPNEVQFIGAIYRDGYESGASITFNCPFFTVASIYNGPTHPYIFLYRMDEHGEPYGDPVAWLDRDSGGQYTYTEPSTCLWIGGTPETWYTGG